MKYVVLLLLLTVGTLSAADWSQFRGPNGSCVTEDKNLPVKWSQKEGYRWKVELPARGVSAPIVHGGKIYITCSSGADDDRLHVLAYDFATGKKLWHRQLAATGGTNCHPMTCMAAPTPVADDTGVYALFATGDLAAFDADGTLRWYRSLVGDYPSITNQVGMAASPILADGKLIVPMDNSGESFLAGLDTKTGTNLWKTERRRDITWVTPTVRSIDGRTPEILFAGLDGLTAYDSATGKKLWNQKAYPGNVPMVTVQGNIIYSPAGGMTALTLEGETVKELWKSPKLSSGYSTPVIYQGIAYAATGAGVLNAVDAKNGQSLWSERYAAKDKASASPIAGDGKVYVFSEKGITTVFKAQGGKDAEILSTNDLGEEILGTPAVYQSTLIIRTNKTLYCIGSK